MTEAWRRRSELLATLPATSHIELEALELKNVAQLLLLPEPWTGKALASLSKKPGLAEIFRRRTETQTPFARFQAIIQSLAEVDQDFTSLALMDRLIVTPIDFRRGLYSVADFWALEGDAFLFHLARCLLKRNPFPREMFRLGVTLAEKGKLAAIREVAARPGANACVVDAGDDQIPLALDKELADLEVLIEHFRSPHAGGWDLRNAYLESARNFDRAWLRMKSLKDIWWAQSNGDIKAICEG